MKLKEGRRLEKGEAGGNWHVNYLLGEQWKKRAFGEWVEGDGQWEGHGYIGMGGGCIVRK